MQNIWPPTKASKRKTLSAHALTLQVRSVCRSIRRRLLRWRRLPEMCKRSQFAARLREFQSSPGESNWRPRPWPTEKSRQWFPPISLSVHDTQGATPRRRQTRDTPPHWVDVDSTTRPSAVARVDSVQTLPSSASETGIASAKPLRTPKLQRQQSAQERCRSSWSLVVQPHLGYTVPFAGPPEYIPGHNGCVMASECIRRGANCIFRLIRLGPHGWHQNSPQPACEFRGT